MELFLNLLWLIASAALTVLLLRQQCTCVSRMHWGVVLWASLFIVVLPFPVISASDDLYSKFFVSEDSSRRVLNAIGSHLEVAPAAAPFSFSAFSAAASGMRFSVHIV
jgi:hypothetical protein